MIETYIAGVVNHGPRFNITLLKGDVHVMRVLETLRLQVKALHGNTLTFKHFWFRTPEGIVFSLSGPRAILDLIPAFMASYDGTHFEGFETLHASAGPVGFERVLREHFTKFTRVRRAHSIGGSRS